MNSNPSVNHHGAAPVVYLKPFSKKTNKDERRNKVVLLTKDRPPELRSIKGVNTVPYQYSVTSFEGIDQDVVERGWRENFENPYRAVRNRLLNGQWPLNPQDRSTLANFMAMSHVKDHRRLDLVRDNSRSSLFNAGTAMGIPPEMTEEILNNIKGEMKDRGNVHLHNSVERYANILASRYKWALVRSKTPLFTGNTPLSITSIYDNRVTTSLEYGIKGFSLALFPISRKLGVFFSSQNRDGTFAGDYPLYRTGEHDVLFRDEKFSDMFRASTIASSSELYVHPDDLSRLLRLSNFSSFNTAGIESLST